MFKRQTIPGELGAGLALGSIAAAVLFIFLSYLLWKIPYPEEMRYFYPQFWENLRHWSAWRTHGLLPILDNMAANYTRYLSQIEFKMNPTWITARFDFALLLSLLVGTLCAFVIAKDRPAIRHLRGSRLFMGRDAVERLKRVAHQETKTDGIGLLLHPSFKWAMSLQRETRHMMVVGAIGSGKTQIIAPLLQAAMARGDRCIVFDSKGDFTQWIPNCTLLAPWDARSKAWDIGEDCSTAQDASELAARVIPEGHDPIWHTAARQILTAILLKLQHQKSVNWTWTDFYQHCCLSRPELVGIIKTFLPEAIHTIDAPEKTTQSILVNFGAHMTVIGNLSSAWGHIKKEDRISLKKWLTRGNGSSGDPKRVLVLQGNGQYPGLAKATLQAMFTLLASHINSPAFGESKTRRIWFFLDEFARLGTLEAIAPLLEIGRSKGIRVVLGAQDIAQIRDIYGENQADTWMSSIGTKIICQIHAGATADYISKNLIGIRKVERITVVKGQRQPAIREDEELVMASDLEAKLGKNKTGITALLLGFSDHYCLHWPFTQTKPLRRASVPAAWLTQSIGPDTPEPTPQTTPNPKPPKPLPRPARLVLQTRGTAAEIALTGTPVTDADEALKDMTPDAPGTGGTHVKR